MTVSGWSPRTPCADYLCYLQLPVQGILKQHTPIMKFLRHPKPKSTRATVFTHALLTALWTGSSSTACFKPDPFVTIGVCGLITWPRTSTNSVRCFGGKSRWLSCWRNHSSCTSGGQYRGGVKEESVMRKLSPALMWWCSWRLTSAWKLHVGLQWPAKSGAQIPCSFYKLFKIRFTHESFTHEVISV